MSGVMVAVEDAVGIPYFSQGVVGITVTAALLVLWRFQRSVVKPLVERAAANDRRLARSELSHRVCDWRVSELVRYHRVDLGLEVPNEIVYGRPPWLTAEEEALLRGDR